MLRKLQINTKMIEKILFDEFKAISENVPNSVQETLRTLNLSASNITTVDTGNDWPEGKPYISLENDTHRELYSTGLTLLAAGDFSNENYGMFSDSFLWMLNMSHDELATRIIFPIDENIMLEGLEGYVETIWSRIKDREVIGMGIACMMYDLLLMAIAATLDLGGYCTLGRTADGSFKWQDKNTTAILAVPYTTKMYTPSEEDTAEVTETPSTSEAKQVDDPILIFAVMEPGINLTGKFKE